MITACKQYKVSHEKYLYAPLSEQEISSFVIPGMTKDELLAECGEVIYMEKSGDLESLEFPILLGKMESSDFVISSFMVLLTNDIVVSWRPTGTGRRTP
jgi:hypothetical protein